MRALQNEQTSDADLATSYKEDGFVFPVDVFDHEQALSYRRELEKLEKRLGDTTIGNKNQLNYPHVIFRFANDIVRNPRILDVVETLIGPDIFVWGATFFIKEPLTESFVSWHQDLRYWGLSDDDGQVSAWLALSPVTKSNGCMRFLPGSHKGELVEHKDTFEDDNVLIRGQEADIEIDENRVTYATLKPGQASFHHGRLLHASAANRSPERRIGLTTNYVAAHVQQRVAKEDFGMLVRGTDRYGHFQHVPEPRKDLSVEAMAWHGHILAAQNEAMYDGVQLNESLPQGSAVLAARKA